MFQQNTKTMTTTTQSQLAANHFLDLYADEIKAKESISADMIYEWWGQTKDQYPSAEYEEVEKAILVAVDKAQA